MLLENSPKAFYPGHRAGVREVSGYHPVGDRPATGFCVGLSCHSPGGGVRVSIGWTFAEFCKSPLWYWLPKYCAWFSRAFAAACRRSRRAAPPGLHGKRLCFRCIVATRRFPGGMRRPHILRSVEELRVICRVFRAGGGASVCVGMRRYGSPVRCGFWHGMSRYGAPEVVRYVSLCFAMFRSLLRLGPPALSRRRRSSRLRDVALCRALSRAGDLRRSRPHFQWNGCRVCCVGFALFRIGRDFFQGTGPPSGCRCPNTRRLGLR